jgi:hypothetical protein
MNITIQDALRNLLNDNATLQGTPYLGGTDRVIVGWINQDTVVPCITIYEADESSTLRPGYKVYKHRDNAPAIHIDTWINRNANSGPTTSRDLNVIADYAEWLIFTTGITSTRSWRRTSSNELLDNANSYLHKARTYGFEYSVTD